MENSSHVNIGAREEVNGMELQIYVGQGKNRICLEESVHRRLVTKLKEIISESICEMKIEEHVCTPEGPALAVAPVSYVQPDDHDFGLQPNNTKSRKHIVVGRLTTSFSVPEDSEINLYNIDQIKRPTDLEEMETESDKPNQFSFGERLLGWSILRTQRPNGRFDMTFFHTKSDKRFRSTVEAINFMLYEVYPPRSTGQRESKRISENVVNGAPTLSPKRKREATEEYVADFLKRSLRNFVRMTDQRKLFGSNYQGDEISQIDNHQGDEEMDSFM